MSQQLVPPPWTGGQADWHCESDVQLPHEPPLLPLLLPDEPLLLLLTPLLLPLPELPPDEPLLDPELPLLLLLTPLLLPLPELPPELPLLLLADTSPPPSPTPKSGGLESPDPHAAAANAKETARALNVASFIERLPTLEMADTATGD